MASADYECDSEILTARDLHDRYSHHLPILVRVLTGFYGAREEMSFSCGQVLRLLELREQMRVLLHDDQHNTLSVPLDFTHTFHVGRNSQEALTIRQIVEHHKLPVTIRFADSSMALEAGLHNTRSMNTLKIVRQHKETYFLANTVAQGQVLETVIPIPFYLKEVTFCRLTGVKGHADGGRGLMDSLLHPHHLHINVRQDYGDQDMVQLSNKPIKANDDIYQNIQSNVYINVKQQRRRQPPPQQVTDPLPAPPPPQQQQHHHHQHQHQHHYHQQQQQQRQSRRKAPPTPPSEVPPLESGAASADSLNGQSDQEYINLNTLKRTMKLVDQKSAPCPKPDDGDVYEPYHEQIDADVYELLDDQTQTRDTNPTPRPQEPQSPDSKSCRPGQSALSSDLPSELQEALRRRLQKASDVEEHAHTETLPDQSAKKDSGDDSQVKQLPWKVNLKPVPAKSSTSVPPEPKPSKSPQSELKPSNSPQSEPRPSKSPQSELKPSTSPQSEPKPSTSPQSEPKPSNSPQSEPKPSTSPQSDLKPSKFPQSELKPSTIQQPEPKPPTIRQLEPNPSKTPESQRNPSTPLQFELLKAIKSQASLGTIKPQVPTKLGKPALQPKPQPVSTDAPTDRPTQKENPEDGIHEKRVKTSSGSKPGPPIVGRKGQDADKIGVGHHENKAKTSQTEVNTSKPKGTHPDPKPQHLSGIPTPQSPSSQTSASPKPSPSPEASPSTELADPVLPERDIADTRTNLSSLTSKPWSSSSSAGGGGGDGDGSGGNGYVNQREMAVISPTRSVKPTPSSPGQEQDQTVKSTDSSKTSVVKPAGTSHDVIKISPTQSLFQVAPANVTATQPDHKVFPPTKAGTSDPLTLPPMEDLDVWTISDVQVLLNRLNLVQYAHKFNDQQIDGHLLQQLTKDMLQQDFGLSAVEIMRLQRFVETRHLPK